MGPDCPTWDCLTTPWALQQKIKHCSNSVLGWTTGTTLCASAWLGAIISKLSIVSIKIDIGSSFTSEKNTEKDWRRKIFKNYFPNLPLILKFRFPEFFFKTWVAALPRQVFVAGSLCISQCTSNITALKSMKWWYVAPTQTSTPCTGQKINLSAILMSLSTFLYEVLNKVDKKLNWASSVL